MAALSTSLMISNINSSLAVLATPGTSSKGIQNCVVGLFPTSNLILWAFSCFDLGTLYQGRGGGRFFDKIGII